MTTITMGSGLRTSRWLLLASLTLNLFFVGTVGALALRHFVAPVPFGPDRPRTAAARVERLAATLPAADAAKLRSAFQARTAAAEAGRDTLNRAIEGIQAALRAQPFDVARLRDAMSQARAARTLYEETMQDILVNAAIAMSPEGRSHLANWPAPRPAVGAR